MFSTSDSVATSSLQTHSFLLGGWIFLLLAFCIFLRSSLFIALPCHVLHIQSTQQYALSLSLHLSFQFHHHTSMHQTASIIIPSFLSPFFRASSVSHTDLHAPPPALHISLSLLRHLSFSTFLSLQLQVCLLADLSVGVVQLTLPGFLAGWLAGCWVIIFYVGTMHGERCTFCNSHTLVLFPSHYWT